MRLSRRIAKQGGVDLLASATTSDKQFGRNPIGPKGGGGTAPLPLSLLLANVHTLTRRRFAEIGAVALATIAMLFRKRATRSFWWREKGSRGGGLHDQKNHHVAHGDAR